MVSELDFLIQNPNHSLNIDLVFHLYWLGAVQDFGIYDVGYLPFQGFIAFGYFIPNLLYRVMVMPFELLGQLSTYVHLVILAVHFGDVGEYFWKSLDVLKVNGEGVLVCYEFGRRVKKLREPLEIAIEVSTMVRRWVGDMSQRRHHADSTRPFH